MRDLETDAMSQLNPNIILGVQRPKTSNPMELYQAKAAMDQNELANRLGGLKVEAFEQERSDANKLRGIYSTFGEDTAKNVNALYQGGMGGEAAKYSRSVAEGKESAAKAEKAQIEKAMKVFELSGQIMSGVTDQATWDRARQQAAEVFGPEAAAKMPAQYDPAEVTRRTNQALSVKEQLEQKWKAMEYTTPNANARLAADTSRANNAASVGATIRGQNMVDSRAREANQSGKIPPGYRATASGGLEAIPGGPADLKVNAAGVAKVSDAKDVLGLLDEVDLLLPKSTGSYSGVAADAVMGAFGGSTQGAQAVAQLKAIQGALVSKMPKMSGPQSDKDVLLYREMAGQVGDATIPVPQRQAASAMIRKLNEKYAGMPEGSSRNNGASGTWAPPAGGVIDFGSLK
jgi:hypothetical protein